MVNLIRRIERSSDGAREPETRSRFPVFFENTSIPVKFGVDCEREQKNMIFLGTVRTLSGTIGQ